MLRPNLYAAIPDLSQGERFEELLRCANVRIERIASAPGSASGPYRQRQDEWVTLLQGEARLEMADQVIRLQAGDCLFIPAGMPHRVLETSTDPPCLWLAVHIFPSNDLDDADGNRYTGER